jgi:spore maturation protein CgeB
MLSVIASPPFNFAERIFRNWQGAAFYRSERPSYPVPFAYPDRYDSAPDHLVSVIPDLHHSGQPRSWTGIRFRMRLVIFGLTISSSWGNGHATLWRGLGRALAGRGHQLTFFEKDLPYYAWSRDLTKWEYGDLVLYGSWNSVATQARDHLARADVALITSYCPDALPAARLLGEFGTGLMKVFYDMDTPVTLHRLNLNEPVEYLPPGGLEDFDLVLSFTGGPVLALLKERLGARRVEPLYGHANPEVHHRRQLYPGYEAALSYLGTFAADRQAALNQLFLKTAQRLPERRFVIAGALYPDKFPWETNIYFVRHLSPAEHGVFFSSSKCTLNLTRSSMAAFGFCPSGRIFEAAACGTPIITDRWAGLEEFFEPGKEIIVAENTEDVMKTISLPDDVIEATGRAAYARFLKQHTSDQRAAQLEKYLWSV